MAAAAAATAWCKKEMNEVAGLRRCPSLTFATARRPAAVEPPSTEVYPKRDRDGHVWPDK